MSGQPAGPDAAKPSLAHGLRWGAVCVLALVVLYRPVACGLVYSLASTTVFGLLLLLSALLWLTSELLGGALRVRLGLPALAFSAFLGAALVASIGAENWFAGLTS